MSRFLGRRSVSTRKEKTVATVSEKAKTKQSVQETGWIPCQTSAWLWAIPCRVPFPCFAHNWRQGPSRSRQCSLPEIASHARADSAPAKRGLWETIETIEKGEKKVKRSRHKVKHKQVSFLPPAQSRAISGYFELSMVAILRVNRACSLRCVELLTISGMPPAAAGASSIFSVLTAGAATSGLTPLPPLPGFAGAGRPASAASTSVVSAVDCGGDRSGTKFFTSATIFGSDCWIKGSTIKSRKVVKALSHWSARSEEIPGDPACEADGPNLESDYRTWKKTKHMKPVTKESQKW